MVKKMTAEAIAENDALEAHPHEVKSRMPRLPNVSIGAVTKATLAQVPDVIDRNAFCDPKLRKLAFYHDEHVLIFNMDVRQAMKHLKDAGVVVNCVVTSPPFYGQRDYGVAGQIGLEDHPEQYIHQLVTCFEAVKPVIAENGSLWVNLGDTYWSGKGEHKSGEAKQSARRFGLRPQDRTGDGQLCKPKQLLLIPHRFAIAMQGKDWIVRNDNVWVKPNPIPDQVRDRCSMSHEYMFHLVKSRWYFFNKPAVARRAASGTMLPPQDTWQVPPVRVPDQHKARFPEEIVRIPILSSTPPNGVVLDPFGGSGTSLMFARKHGFRAIAVDLKREFCQAMVDRLREIE
jgi:site-specific DNA-methyltransferase (cytosine-N4-specific)